MVLPIQRFREGAAKIDFSLNKIRDKKIYQNFFKSEACKRPGLVVPDWALLVLKDQIIVFLRITFLFHTAAYLNCKRLTFNGNLFMEAAINAMDSLYFS